MKIKTLLVVTAEPSNFVPKELKRAGEQLGLETKIIDLTHVVLVEGMSSEGPESALFCVKPADKEVPESKAEVEKLEVCSETMVISRLNEYHLDVKLSILKRMQSAGAQMLNTPESMALCNDKLMTHVVLNNACIKSPYSFAMTNVDDIETTVDWLEKEGKLKYPIIIKTLRGTHGIGVMKLDSRASLVSVAQLIFVDSQKDKNEFRTNAHLGSQTEPYNPSEDEVALGSRIVELFGCKFCAIDYLIKDHENGSKEFVILEVNGSPGLENIQTNWPDRDLPLDVVKGACGESSTTVANDTPAATTEPTDAALPDEVVQEVEPVIVHRVFNDPIEARIDTGAKYSSIHADWLEFDEEWTKFKRDDVTYKVHTDRVIKIKNIHGGDSSKRAMVRLDITIKGKRLNGVEFTVNDRGHMKYEVLIGRNILEQLGIPVLVSKSAEQGGEPQESDIYTIEEE